jgi:hypothetical protein
MSLLEKATGRGLITLGEFSERSAVVITAKTRGELNAVLLDLPGLSIAGRTVEEAREQTAASSPSRIGFGDEVPGVPGYRGYAGNTGYPGYAPTGYAAGPPGTQGIPWSRPPTGVHTLELTGWGSRVYRGYWVVPQRIVIGGAGASTKLDFTSAQLTTPTVRIEFVGNGFGSVELIVAPGTAIRLDGLQLRGGTVDNRVPPPSGPVNLVLELVGVKRAGSLIIRYPKRRGRR